MLIRRLMLKEDPKLKKKIPELVEEESDFDQDVQEATETVMKEQELDRLRKKLERSNQKLREGSSKIDDKNNDDDDDGGKIQDKIYSPEEIEKHIKDASKKAGLINLKDKLEKMSLERLEKRFNVLVDKIRSQKMTLIDKVNSTLLAHAV